MFKNIFLIVIPFLFIGCAVHKPVSQKINPGIDSIIMEESERLRVVMDNNFNTFPDDQSGAIYRKALERETHE